MLCIQMQLGSRRNSQASIQNYSLQLDKDHWICLHFHSHNLDSDIDTEIKTYNLYENQVEFGQKI